MKSDMKEAGVINPPDSALRPNASGFSLVEALITLCLLSCFTLPLALIVQHGLLNAQGSAVQSTRNILMMKLADAIDPENPNFTTDYTDSAMQSVLESGVPIGYLRVADTSVSDNLNRRLNIYIYNKTTDSLTAPRYKMTQDYVLDEIRLDVGQTAQGFQDSANQIWIQDTAYNSGNRVPGWVTGGSTGNNAGAVSNTVDDVLYQTYREGATVSYSFNLPNGKYTVQLYFVEFDSSINGTSNRRLCDISLEGGNVLSAYSPFETAGATGKADIRSFDVTLSDGVLNLVMTKSAASNQNPRLSAIAIRPHV